MSVQVDALADEVFEAAGAVSRATAHRILHPFGEVITAPDFPDISSLHALRDLKAADWTVDRLEAVLRAEVPAARYNRIATRDPATRDHLGPRLLAAGYRPEHELAMLEVAAPSIAITNPPSVLPVDSEARWAVLDSLIREESASESPATIDQLQRLARLGDRAAGDRPHLAVLDGAAIGRVSLLPHRTTAYVHALNVRPAFRDRGHGTAIMLALRVFATSAGCERIGLLSLTDPWRVAFYRRLGYVTVGDEYTWMKLR